MAGDQFRSNNIAFSPLLFGNIENNDPGDALKHWILEIVRCFFFFQFLRAFPCQAPFRNFLRADSLHQSLLFQPPENGGNRFLVYSLGSLKTKQWPPYSRVGYFEGKKASNIPSPNSARSCNAPRAMEFFMYS